MGNAVTNAIDPLFYAWNLEHNFYAFTHDWAKLLDTNIFYPETNTLAFSDHLFGQTIFLFPLFFLIKNPLIIQNLYLLSTFVLSAFGVYLLTRHLTNSQLASFVAGLIYSFSLYHFDHLGQVTTTSIQWLPFAFLYLFKSFNSNKISHFLLFWLFFSLNFLSTLYYGIFLTVAVGLFLILKAKKQQRTIIKLVLFSIPFMLLLLISSYPYIRFRLENPIFRRTLEEASWRSANVSDYLRRIPTAHDRALFPGITAFVLTGGSFFIRKKKFPQLYFISLLIFSFILSLGPEKWGIKLPYYYLYKIFPLMQAIRVPARFGVLTTLCFSVLSGISLTHIIKRAAEETPWRPLKGELKIFLVKPYNAIKRIVKIFTKRVKLNFNLHPKALTSDPFYGVARRLYRLRAIVFLNVVFIGVFLESLHIPIKLTKVPRLSEAPPVYHWLTQQQGTFAILELPLRIGAHSNPIEEQVNKNYQEITESDNFIAETFRVYFSILHRKKMLNGYSSYFPPSYMETAQIMENFPSQETVNLLKKRKIKYIISHTTEYGKRWGEIERQLLEFPELKLQEKFGSDYVYSPL